MNVRMEPVKGWQEIQCYAERIGASLCCGSAVCDNASVHLGECSVRVSQWVSESVSQ